MHEPIKMLRIKKLDIFIVKSFLMLFVGTFFICLFIFMMQFLWRYVDELVGKGLDMSVIAQFFFYSALTLSASIVAVGGATGFFNNLRQLRRTIRVTRNEGCGYIPCSKLCARWLSLSVVWLLSLFISRMSWGLLLRPNWEP